MSALTTRYNSPRTTQPAQGASPLSAPPSGSAHPQSHHNTPQEPHTSHATASQAAPVHPASPHKSASPETDSDSTTAVHTKSTSPPSTSDESHPQTSSGFMMPHSASSMSTKPASPGRTSAAKARSEPDIKTKGYAGSALGQDRTPSAPLAICMEENNAEAKGGNGRGLYGHVDVQKVGGRSKMLSKRTPTVTKFEDGRELDQMGEGGDDKQRDHIEQEVKPEIQDAQVGSASKDKKRKTRESDDDNGKANVKMPKTGAKIEPIEDSPPSEIDELRDDDSGEEGEGSETDEFDPLDEVDVFDYKARLENDWDVVQDQMERELLSWANGFIEQSLRQAYHVVQMYHKLSKTSQEELRNGIKDIKDQEEIQMIARGKIADFTEQFNKFLHTLK